MLVSVSITGPCVASARADGDEPRYQEFYTPPDPCRPASQVT
ncbi:secretory lipase family domain protein [Mycobacterium xenopi 4042]|uniref:Secretory lipase family domain protein n=1 Tax=Mycobacterium xenopi 4042 TaxID=1299334 RepID=X7Z4G3_MYCXE|nr:secretory lipase family domain protein [Mycobacterium xenopi 4042]